LIGANSPPGHAVPEGDEVAIARPDKPDVRRLLHEPNDFSWDQDVKAPAKYKVELQSER
jgi:hypothetical protein